MKVARTMTLIHVPHVHQHSTKHSSAYKVKKVNKDNSFVPWDFARVNIGSSNNNTVTNFEAARRFSTTSSNTPTFSNILIVTPTSTNTTLAEPTTNKVYSTTKNSLTTSPTTSRTPQKDLDHNGILSYQGN